MLLFINCMEFSGAALSYIHLLTEKLIITFDSDNINKEEFEMCASVNNSIILNFQFLGSSYVLLTVVRTLTELADMLVIVVLTSLMRYLISRMKKSCHMNIRRYICIKCLIGVAMLIASYYTFLTPLGKLAYLVVITNNYVLFLNYVKKFKQSLLQSAMERLVQHKSNRIEMKQYRYFSYSINCICIGFSFLMVGAYLGITARNMISFIFFGECVFPTAFLPQLISLDSLNETQITKIFTILHDMNTLSRLSIGIGVFITAFPLFFITICIWKLSAVRMMKRESPTQHRYPVFSCHGAKTH